MEQQIKEILQRIDFLEKLVNTIQNNINTNMQLFISMLALIAAAVGGALYFLVKILVNKRVEEELNKCIQSNPPTLYYQGILDKISSTNNGEGNWYSESVINIDCEKLHIKSLNFPVEFNLFYTHEEKFKIADMDLKDNVHTTIFRILITEYNAIITNEGIKVYYKESPYNKRDIIWTLKVPNPIYNNFNRNY